MTAFTSRLAYEEGVGDRLSHSRLVAKALMVSPSTAAHLSGHLPLSEHETGRRLSDLKRRGCVVVDGTARNPSGRLGQVYALTAQGWAFARHGVLPDAEPVPRCHHCGGIPAEVTE